MTSILLIVLLLSPQADFEAWSSQQWQHYVAGELDQIDTGATGDWSVGTISDADSETSVSITLLRRN